MVTQVPKNIRSYGDLTFGSSSLWYLWRPNPLADYSRYTSETYSLELSIARGPRQLNERTIISSFFLGLKFERYMWYIWVCLTRLHLQHPPFLHDPMLPLISIDDSRDIPVIYPFHTHHILMYNHYIYPSTTCFVLYPRICCLNHQPSPLQSSIARPESGNSSRKSCWPPAGI